MMQRNCFIDKNGNVWKENNLIKHSKHLPIIQFRIASISLDEAIRWSIINLRDYVAHFKRVQEADIKIPIILRSDFYPVDGWHRIIKALSIGMEYLPARKFKIDPEPDFKVDENDRQQNTYSQPKS